MSGLIIAQAAASHYTSEIVAFTSMGGKQQSATYTQLAATGEVVVLSSTGACSTHYRIRSGYLGQSVEVQTLGLGFADSPDDLSIKENTSRPLKALVTLDDGTQLYPESTSLDWEVGSGALTTPSIDNLLRAGAVPASALAEIDGYYRGVAGTLTVLIEDVIVRYADWQSNYFTATEILSDSRAQAESSYAGDNVPNLLKYALGLDPRTPFNASLTSMSFSAGRLQLTFYRYARPDLTWQVQASNDLVTWAPIWTATGEAGATGNVTVQDTTPISITNPRRFLRLAVVRN